MNDFELSEAGLAVVAAGEESLKVAVAEVMLAVYRTLRILQLMDESGHHEWEGITRDELGAWLTESGDLLGLEHGNAEHDGAIYRFIEFRMQVLASMSYADYLLTPEWMDVRRFALWRAGSRCQTCNAKGRLQVHHRTYDRRGHEHLDDVTVLCGTCHKAFHKSRSLTR